MSKNFSDLESQTEYKHPVCEKVGMRKSGNSSVLYSDIMKPNPPLKNPSYEIHLASEEFETNTSIWSGVMLHKILLNVLQLNLNTIRSAG